LLALAAQEGTFEVLAFNQAKLEESTDSHSGKSCANRRIPPPDCSRQPFSFDTERWLAEWNAAARRSLHRRIGFRIRAMAKV
jgi:hypothetical protein